MSAPEDGRSRAPAASDFRATLREMWETRPARRRDDRKVLGVAAAIARRYAVDPTLVRVVIVVAAFYGVGILAYVIGWLVLPQIGPDGRRHTSSGWAIVAAVIVGLVTLGSVIGQDAGSLVGLLVVTALLFALHQSRGGVVTAAPGSSAPADAATTAVPPTDADGAPRPPAWDPLGAAPFAWDLPEPSTPPPPRAPRSWHTPVTLALALVAAGVVLALGLLGVLPLGVTPVVATALLVVGAGLLTGAFRRRGRALIVAAVPLALVLVAAASGGVDRGFDGRGPAEIGDATWAPTGQLLPVYETGVGDARLDLRGLPAGPPASTTVRSGIGDVTVLLPENADVTVDCSSGAGDVDCLGRGPGRYTDLGPDGPGGAVVDLHAMGGAGDVEVRRG